MKTNLKTAGLSLLGLVFLSSVIYALGVLDFASSSANPSTKQGLSVQGVPNKVEYLQALTISGTDGKKVKLEYMSASGYLEISGAVNMDSLVVGTNNQAGKHSAVFGGSGNQVNATASAVVGGQQNSLSGDSTNSVIAGSNSALLGENSEQVFIGAKKQNSSHQNSSNQNVIVLGNSSANNSTNTFVAGTNSVSNSSFSVVLGTGISLGDKSNVFVYSNSGDFSPQTGNAFYVNAKEGVAVNHDQVNAQLDINGGLVLSATDTTTSSLPPGHQYQGTIAMVQKGQEIGLCGHDGKAWIPLSQSAKEKNLCVQGAACIVPENATKTSDQNSCQWSCNAGFVQINGENKCYSVSWQKTDQAPVCKDNGKYHEGKVVSIYQCKVDNQGGTHHGQVVPDEKCNASQKPNQEERKVYLENCNGSDDRWNCDPVSCDDAGECGGKTKQVNCRIEGIDQNLKAKTYTQQKTRTCDRPCENGQCNRTYYRGQAQNLTPNSPLCANGTIANFQPTMRNNIVTGWTWACNAKDANVECSSANQTPGSAKCAPDINKCSAGEVHDVADTAEAVKWECRSSVPGANNASCIICKPGYQDDGNKNCVPVPQKCNKCAKDGFPYCFDVDFSPNCGENSPLPPTSCQDGFSLVNGKCVQWRCDTSLLGSSVGSCYSKTTNAPDSLCNSITEKEECNSAVETTQYCHDSPSACASRFSGIDWYSASGYKRLFYWSDFIDSTLSFDPNYTFGMWKINTNSNSSFGYEFTGVCKWKDPRTYAMNCVDSDGNVLNSESCQDIFEKPHCGEYTWLVQPHGMCRWISENVCHAKDGPNDYDAMQACVGLNNLECSINEKCSLLHPTIKVKDSRVMCVDSNGMPVDDNLCDFRLKPKPYVYCGEPSIDTVKCYTKDLGTTVRANQRVVDIKKSPNYTVPVGYFLVADFSYSNSYLYVPISYYAGHTSSVRGTLTITADISNGGGAVYRDTVGVYDVQTLGNYPGSDIHLKVKFDQQMYNGSRLSSIPCDWNDSQCQITIKNAKLELPEIPTHAPGCSY